jgi:hypothetical protein
MSKTESTANALQLLEAGWRTNMAAGSITHIADHRDGVVDLHVWNAMKQLQADHQGWQRTSPQQLQST